MKLFILFYIYSVLYFIHMKVSSKRNKQTKNEPARLLCKPCAARFYPTCTGCPPAAPPSWLNAARCLAVGVVRSLPSEGCASS